MRFLSEFFSKADGSTPIAGCAPEQIHNAGLRSAVRVAMNAAWKANGLFIFHKLIAPTYIRKLKIHLVKSIKLLDLRSHVFCHLVTRFSLSEICQHYVTIIYIFRKPSARKIRGSLQSDKTNSRHISDILVSSIRESDQCEKNNFIFYFRLAGHTGNFPYKKFKEARIVVEGAPMLKPDVSSMGTEDLRSLLAVLNTGEVRMM
jgi:hypothetical protein